MQAFSNFFSCLKDSFCRKKLYTPLLKYKPVLTTAAWSLNCKHFSLVIDQNVHTHTMRILSLTLDGYGHSYPGSTTRFSGSRPTRMNVCADAMATEYSDNAQHSSETPSSQPAFFPSANVSLLINSQRVTSQYTESIRFHIHGTKHRAHLQKN